MPNVSVHTYTVLDQIRDELEGANGISAQLTVLSGEGLPSLTTPTAYRITPDTEEPSDTLPVCYLYTVAPVAEDDLMTPHRFTRLPLRVEIHYRIADANRETAYHYGHIYCRAIDMAIKARYENTDAHFVDVLSTDVTTGNARNRYYSVASLDADVHVLTQRKDS